MSLLPTDVRTPLPLLVAGGTVASRGDDTVEVVDPSRDEVIATVPAGCEGDADAAVGAALAAFPGGAARTAPAARGGLLKAAARRLRGAVEELTEIQSRESGKPLEGSRGGVMAGIETIEQFAELAPLHRGATLQGAFGAIDFMAHEPRGVAVALTPWNDPVAIACQLIAANLLVGNTVVFKPSERTPLCGARLVELIAEDLPPGVLNLVHGDGRCGRPLAAHPDVRLVCLVGSVRAGRDVAAATARTGAKALLELGGKDPLIVDAGVDPAWAAAQAATGAFANSGQICVAVERVYVHESLAQPFLAALVKEAEAAVVGDPRDPRTTLGPLVDRRHREAVHAHVAAAVEAGARALTGGTVPAGAGAYYPPTVLTDVRDDMAVMREETFGPVAPVAVVPSFDDALTRAAASSYGLAAVVLTADMDHAQRAWRELPVGTVKINAAFGGAPGGAAEPHAGSGRGLGYGPELLDECATTKAVHLEPPVT